MKKYFSLFLLLYSFMRISAQQIDTFPYFDNFNAGAGGWVAENSATNTSPVGIFTHAVLPAEILNGAEGEGSSWYVKRNNISYYYSLSFRLTSPEFDFSNVTNPKISFDIKTTENTNVLFQYSIDGAAWETLGNVNDATWYNNEQGNGWSGILIESWTRMQHDLCALSGKAHVRFRFIWSSDYGQRGNAFAMDNFAIDAGEKEKVKMGAVSFVSDVHYTCDAQNGAQAEGLSVVLQNNSCRDLFNIPIEIKVEHNGITTVYNETIAGPITRLDYTVVLLNSSYDMQDVGTYKVSLHLNLPNNENLGDNDAIFYHERKGVIENFPYTENFNTSTGGWEPHNAVECNFLYGQLPNSILNGAEGQGTSWYAARSVAQYNDKFYLESPIFNLSTLSNPYLTFDMKCDEKTYVSVDYSIDGGSWQRLGTNADLNWYYDDGNIWWGKRTDSWQSVIHELCSLNKASCVKFRIVWGRQFDFDGNSFYFALDNISIQDAAEPIQQQALTTVQSPQPDVCMYPNVVVPSVQFRHTYSCNDVAPKNIPIQLEVSGPNGLNEIYQGQIQANLIANGVLDYSFLSATLDMSVVGSYFFKYTISPTNDFNPDNNVLYDTIVVDRPIFNTYPYTSNFNDDAGGFLSAEFSREVLPNSLLNGAEGEGLSWLSTADEHAYLESPIYDMTTNDVLQISFDIKKSRVKSVKVEYSIDGGVWQRLGSGADANWYDNTNSWYGQTIDGWTHVSHSLCALMGNSCVRFRIHSWSSGAVAIDNMSIVVAPNPLTASISTSANSVCLNNTSPNITLTGVNGTPPYTFAYTLNGQEYVVSTAQDESTYNIIVPTQQLATYSYKLIRVINGDCEQALNMPLVEVNVVKCCLRANRNTSVKL